MTPLTRVAAMCLVSLACSLVASTAQAQEALDTSAIFVKKAIAETLTPDQLEAYKQRLARNFAGRAAPRADLAPTTPGDTCGSAVVECAPFPGPKSDTTVGAADNYDLPPDTAAPTCALSGCTGAGPVGSLPAGAIYTGTGTAPDRAWWFRTDANCTLTITATPTSGWDLALIVYQAACSNSLSDCLCVDDTGLGGVGETVTLNAIAGTDYFAVIDGYSTGGTPPGPSGPYTLAITGSGCSFICPVELQGFRLE